MIKKVVNMRGLPTTVYQSSIDRVLEEKKKQRKERIEGTKEKINKLRAK